MDTQEGMLRTLAMDSMVKGIEENNLTLIKEAERLYTMLVEKSPSEYTYYMELCEIYIHVKNYGLAYAIIARLKLQLEIDESENDNVKKYVDVAEKEINKLIDDM